MEKRINPRLCLSEPMQRCVLGECQAACCLYGVWIDREEIHGGDLWREAIVEAVDHAYAFVLMLSPASVASDNVRKEVDLADGAGKALLPFFLGGRNKLR